MPYTKLPRPEGRINLYYDLMSPPNWGIAPSNIHVFVYRDVRIALQALLQSANTIQAQRLEAGGAALFSEHLFFRGQSDVTQRLLPTRLRGKAASPAARQRHDVRFDGKGEDPRTHVGAWFEDIEPWRSIEDSLSEISAEELARRDVAEDGAVQRACSLEAVANLDGFRKRAAVRHYGGVPSSLLDVSTDPEVAAFFATASSQSRAGQIGMLWGIDLNFFTDIFSIEVGSVPGGIAMRLKETREGWGANKKMFEDYGVAPTAMELRSVELPFRRPQAQRARFLSLSGEGGSQLPTLSELTWWSIIERRAYMCAFLHDGSKYENPGHNISAATLLPSDEPLAATLQ
jgi:hypothetical protein